MSADNDRAEERVQCFDSLFREHQRGLYGYLFGQTGSREHAEDLLQQVFVRVWRHIDEVEIMPIGKVKPWLFSIASNLAVDHRRRESVRIQTSNDTAETPAPGRNPGEEAELRESMERLNQAIINLPEDMRIAFSMTILGEMTSEEVGHALGKPAGTIRYLVSEARKKIQQEVER